MQAEIDIHSNVMTNLKVDVVVHGYYRYKIRMWIGLKLLKVSLFIMDLYVDFWDEDNNKIDC